MTASRLAITQPPPTPPLHLPQALSNARGWKTVVKFFPNDAACLEPVTFLLYKVEAEGRQKTTVDDDKVLLGLTTAPSCPPPHGGCPWGRAGRAPPPLADCGDSACAQGGTWESMCTLLLWLSMLVLIPFDLSSVDTSQSVLGTSEASLSTPLPPEGCNAFRPHDLHGNPNPLCHGLQWAASPQPPK